MKWSFRRAGAAFLLPCFLFTALLSGCSSHRELRELSIVEGIGVDLNPDGSYFVTFQVYQPQGQGGSSDKGGATNQTGIVQGTGKSLFDVSRQVTLQMGKKLYYANCNILILGRAVCKQNLYDVMDFLTRNHEINGKERVFMAENKAEDILTAQQGGGYIPAHDLRLLSENYYNTSQMVDQQLNDLADSVSYGITTPYLGVLTVKKDQSPGSGQQSSGSGQGGGQGGSGDSEGGKQIVEANGTAFFNQQGKLLGVMDKDQTRGLMWITGKVRSGVINVASSQIGKATMEIRRAKSSLRVSTADNRPVIEVNVYFTSGITELSLLSTVPFDEATIKKLTKAQNEAVREETESALQIALRQHSSDIFGFGKEIFEFRPNLWRKLSQNWPTQAAQTQVKVSVSSTIMHAGMTYR